jgi:hypothetical protein
MAASTKSKYIFFPCSEALGSLKIQHNLIALKKEKLQWENEKVKWEEQKKQINSQINQLEEKA